jgi:hypothetical protein
MNFTAKTKGSNGFDAGSDNLFFAEVTYLSGEELTVNCCCVVNSVDNGILYSFFFKRIVPTL